MKWNSTVEAEGTMFSSGTVRDELSLTDRGAEYMLKRRERHTGVPEQEVNYGCDR